MTHDSYETPDSYRVLVADALAKTGEENEETASGMLLGFVAVAEWMAPDGERWLTCITGTGAGEHIPKWQTRGYLHEALFCWPDEDDDAA